MARWSGWGWWKRIRGTPSMPHYSWVRPPQRGLEAYYLDLCRRTDLPVMIYHIPGRAAVNINADTVARIAESAPNLVGIKHASNDLSFVSDLIARLGAEFRIHVGLEDLSFPMVCLGAHGLMNAVGNLLPGKVQELYSATAAGDLARGRALHYELWELNPAIFFDINPIPMKYMMKRMGLLPNEAHRLPMVPATPELAARLDGVLQRAVEQGCVVIADDGGSIRRGEEAERSAERKREWP